MHQQIHLRPTPTTVVIDRLFDIDTVISSYDVRVRYPGRDTLNARLYKSPDHSEYYIQLFYSGGGDSTPPMKVAFTYGGRGWIERFLVEVDGRYYVPPFQYMLPGYRARTDIGGEFVWLDHNKWTAIDDGTQEAVFYSFGSTTFKKQSWHEACATCHINGMARTWEQGDTAKIYTLRFPGSDQSDSLAYAENILIGCESCHGPGSEHVAAPTVDNIVSPGRRAQFPRTFTGTDLKLDICSQCHDRFRSTGGTHAFAYDETNDMPFMPGTSLQLYRKDSITGMTRWPDGFTSYAHHQTGQDYRFSKPYLDSVFQDGCWSCHTVHHVKYDSSYGGELPYQLNQNWYTMESGKGCLASGCHAGMDSVGYSAKRGMTVNLHTQHANDVSQCVNCHFTKTATIGFAGLPHKPLYEFSNHNFRVLSPKVTLDFAPAGGIGMLNTCAESCHRNGRGSRNFSDTTPVAPDFGIIDRFSGNWTEPTDRRLADSLLKYFTSWYQATGGVVDAGAGARSTRITSVAPNPFRDQTTIRFTVLTPGELTIEVYNSSGAVVRVLAKSSYQKGSYSEIWAGEDDRGAAVPSGAYLVRITDRTGASSGQQVILAR